MCNCNSFSSLCEKSCFMRRPVSHSNVIWSLGHSFLTAVWVPSMCLWAGTDFSHGLRKCRGVIEIAPVGIYVGRVIFLFLSTVLESLFLLVQNPSLVSLSRLGPGERSCLFFFFWFLRPLHCFLPFLPYSLIVTASLIMGPLAGHTAAE